ncbi:hypothetical protein Scep_002140 [Stephania cephalantha]|uniref:Integrase catalytic domain-containing protein n=1 Tax=Stephania cephalantha TaxID=152367 RepID=A0AAP0LDD6_9MAGN
MEDIKTKKVLLHGILHNGLYRFFGSPGSSVVNNCAFLTVNKNLSSLWHARLGHPAQHTLQKVLQLVNVPAQSVEFCSSCPLGKSHALPFHSSLHNSTHVLDLIHTDLWGPSPVKSTSGYSYYVHFMDDCTRFTWIYPLKIKSDAFPAFLHFKKFVENQFSSKIKRVQSDWGGEYRSFKPFLDSCGIAFQHSCPHVHEQNGRAERKHRHIIEMCLTLLAHSNLPHRFWWDACEASVFLINRLPTRILKGLSPYEKLYHKPPDYSLLRVFGCSCFPYLRPYNSHKFQFRSERCLFLGYSSSHKGYKYLHKSGRLYITRHVVFNEEEFPYHMLFFPSSSTDRSESSSSIFLPTPSLSISTSFSSPNLSQDKSPSMSVADSAHASSQSNSSDQSTSDQSASPSLTTSPPGSDSHLPLSTDISESEVPLNTHPMITRSKDGIVMKKVFVATTTVPTIEIPKTVELALKDPQWREAMEMEYKALIRTGTWSLVPASSSHNIVGNKWIFSIKKNSDGSVSRYKARLVAKGFKQMPVSTLMRPTSDC